MKISRWIVLAMIAAFLCTVFSCGTHRRRERLEAINAMASRNPGLAISMLDSIDAGSLDDYNRHFYDFLAIKTADKAYVTHRSDSLYRKVEGYFSRHKDDLLYPEVLYYGGRVYSDLGDYPRALKYFQESLELIPENQENLQLRLNALSQTGRLLNKNRLYNQALYLEECVEIDSVINDSKNLVEDLSLMATIYRNKGYYAKAENLLNRALLFSHNIPEEQIAALQGEISLLKFYQGDVDSALMLIRGIPEKVDKCEKEFFYAGASRIYYAAGAMDTAYVYAKKVKDSNNLTWSRSGYKILLSPGVKELSRSDTIDFYLKQYLDVLEKIYDNNQNEAALLQNTQYNYTIYEKDNLQLRDTKKNLIIILGLTLLVVILTVIIILTIKYRNIKIREELKDSLLTIHNINNQYSKNGDVFFPVNGIKSLDSIKEALKKETEVLSEIFSKAIDSNLYISTESYSHIQDCVSKNQCINEAGWKIILKTVEETSPGFIDRINKVSIEPLTEEDLRLLCLIKMGINASNASKLMSKSKGTITYRRKKLRNKLNLEKISLESLDKAIQLI